MTEQDEVRQHGHGNPRVIPFDDGVGVKLPSAASRYELEIPAARHDQTFHAVPPYVLHQRLRVGQIRGGLRIGFIPDVDSEIFRSNQNGEAREIALNPDALNLLYLPLEVPGAIGVAEDAPALRVPLAAFRAEQQQLFRRNFDQAEIRRRHLNHTHKVVVAVEAPFIQRLLRPNRELLPADQTVVILAFQAWVVPLSQPPLIYDFVCAPAEGQKGENLADGIRPGVLHIIHAALHKLRRLFVLGLLSARLYVP